MWTAQSMFMRSLFALSQVMMSLSQNVCLSEPCLNGGMCNELSNGYTCLCTPDYSGATCDTLMVYHAIDPIVDPVPVVDPVPPVGMGQDENGCYTDGGYQWRERLNECVLPWETPYTEPTLPPDCVEWFDGCNRCSVVNGALQLCSMMLCYTQSTPECLAYSSLSVGDVCFQFCEDGSQNPVHKESGCPRGSECVAPNTISFDSCGVNAWTCQESH